MHGARIIKRYRITWRDRFGVIHYANRTSGGVPKVRWSPLSVEYPDHFSKLEVNKICEFYSDQAIRYYSVHLAVDENA